MRNPNLNILNTSSSINHEVVNNIRQKINAEPSKTTTELLNNVFGDTKQNLNRINLLRENILKIFGLIKSNEDLTSDKKIQKTEKYRKIYAALLFIIIKNDKFRAELKTFLNLEASEQTLIEKKSANILKLIEVIISEIIKFVLQDATGIFTQEKKLKDQIKHFEEAFKYLKLVLGESFPKFLIYYIKSSKDIQDSVAITALEQEINSYFVDGEIDIKKMFTNLKSLKNTYIQYIVPTKLLNSHENISLYLENRGLFEVYGNLLRLGLIDSSTELNEDIESLEIYAKTVNGILHTAKIRLHDVSELTEYNLPNIDPYAISDKLPELIAACKSIINTLITSVCNYSDEPLTRFSEQFNKKHPNDKIQLNGLEKYIVIPKIDDPEYIYLKSAVKYLDFLLVCRDYPNKVEFNSDFEFYTALKDYKEKLISLKRTECLLQFQIHQLKAKLLISCDNSLATEAIERDI